MPTLAELYSRVRRNHGLEHATIHLLAQRHPNTFLAGHSDHEGFWLLGDVPTEEVEAAVHEALERLHKGEHRLAIHPGCGTNYLVSGGLAALAGALAMLGTGRRWRDKLDRIPLAIMFGTVVLMFSQPLGFLLQEKVTTSSKPEGLEVVKVVPSQRGKMTAHRVLTRG